MSATLAYLSPEWWRCVASTLREGGPSGERLVVKHICFRPAAVHYQVFEGDRLVGWTPEISASHDLVLVRTLRVDALDLFGLVSSFEVPQQTRLALEDDVSACDLLAAELVRDFDLGLDIGETSVLAVLRCSKSPFGEILAALSVGPRHTSIEFLSNPSNRVEADCYIECAFIEALEWLHNPELLLGHLITKGRRVSGDLVALSTLEGFVSAPRPLYLSPDVRETLLRYSLARTSSRTLDALDKIEGFTSNPSLPIGPIV